MNQKEVILGVDIGGTNTKFGLVDRQGNCFEATSIPTQAQLPVGIFLSNFYREVDDIQNKIKGVFDLKGIGVGAPNGNYYRGTIEQAPNLNWGEVVEFVQTVRQKYKMPVKITNDANAAALGEMKFGVAKGMKNFVVITLGTGLGSGIVVNGDLVYGYDGFAGELGHTTVFIKGREHTTGRQGSLETYVSATGIKRTAFKLLAKSIEPSELRNISFRDLQASDITLAAQKGDSIALRTFDYTAKTLGVKLADLIALLSPEAIILFGGLANAGDLLLEPAKKYMELYNMNIFRNKVKLLVSDMKGGNAAVLGAAALTWHEIDKTA